MLFIKFIIQDQEKYRDFKEIYNHMVMTRRPGFEFKEDEPPEIDWSAPQNEIDKAIELVDFFFDTSDEERRYQKLIPHYVNLYFEKYTGFDSKRAGQFSFEVLDIFNYIEFSFEVVFSNLQNLEPNIGLIEFEALAFPFGGMERFLITLKAYGLKPIECFNGFTIYKFNWTSEFIHEAISLPEATAAYKNSRDYLFQ